LFGSESFTVGELKLFENLEKQLLRGEILTGTNSVHEKRGSDNSVSIDKEKKIVL